MSIQILDPYLASQIAAGEVIERPSSVLKELLENSLDSGAQSLEITINKGGSSLIQIRDNGCGIAKDDLALALHRHATSKISKFEDLEHVLTLGFRGEALASISSVSRLSLTSRTAEQSTAWRIAADGREPSSELVPTAHPIGTTIEVHDLFFNTPARRKFLRNEATEFRHLAEVVNRLALSRFDVAFTVKHNDRLYLKLDAAETPTAKIARIATVCDPAFAEQALEVTSEKSGFKLTGWIGQPTFARSKTDLQYFYINGRIVRDKLLLHALRLAYQDVLARDKQPAFVLYLELNPELVDVNVHPTKHEVRFRDSRLIHDFLVHSLKQTLATTNPSQGKSTGSVFTSQQEVDNATPINLQEETKLSYKSQENTVSNLNFAEKRTDYFNIPITEEFEPKIPPPTQQPFIKKEPTQPNHQDNFTENEIQRRREDDNSYKSLHEVDEIYKQNYFINQHDTSEAPKNKTEEPVLPLGFALAQLHGTYILAQNATGLVIIDAHAAHERVTYEKLKQAYAANELKAQPLLLPLTIPVTRQEIACVEEYQAELEKLGLELACLGENTVAVRKMPALLHDADLENFIHEVLADLATYEESVNTQNYVDKILSTFACHHSIRAHRKMTIPEMNELLRQLEKTARGNQCNHGRPTWLQMTLGEIGKKFMR
ncbi:MAG: DNA mismatch repair protein MutL [Gammaproteobacteria bacterium GWE2_37_16]|nr:MAG: DNA mismatch repair protein MutL [Gammaproteobacteria bacterium GWE2_37_16]